MRGVVKREGGRDVVERGEGGVVRGGEERGEREGW